MNPSTHSPLHPTPNLTIVQVVEFLDVGDGVHRFHAPARALSRLPGVTVIDIDAHHRHFHMLAEMADVLVMGAFSSDLFSIFEERRRHPGRVTVVEANDYYPDLQAWNPLSMRWLDRSLQDSFHHALRAADGVQASVAPLVERWKRITHRPVVAFANHLESLPPLALDPVVTSDRPLTVGWGGSPGHFADWMAVAPVLERWLARRPNARLAVMTNELARDFVRIDATRLVFRPFGSLDDWLDFIGTLDIGLAPLLPTEYNRCRSDVKFLEYASRGVPGIYRDLEPYRDSVVHGETGLTYSTDDELLACLDALADDASLRARIREQAHEAVSRDRLLDDRSSERLSFYQSLGARAGGALDTTLLEEGVRDDRYVRLEPGPAEQALRDALNAPASPELERSLTAVTQAYPRYLAAWQQLGTIRNSLKSPHAAVEALSFALGLDPMRARTWAELGRSHWMRNDVAQALHCLTRAIQANPRYAPAWFSLIEARRRNGETVALPMLDAAAKMLPFNYSLALTIISNLNVDERINALIKALERAACVPEEEPLAAPAFVSAVSGLPPALQASSEGRDLLRRLCDAFPRSPRLAALLAQAETTAGSTQAATARARADELEVAARLYEAEGIDEGLTHLWKIATHLRDATPQD